MHTIDLAKYSLRTDLIIENKEDKNIKTTTISKDKHPFQVSHQTNTLQFQLMTFQIKIP